MADSYRLSQIWYYPIKSLPGIRLKTARAGLRGLEGDRRFMLCDNSNRFISIRERKDLYRFSVTPGNGHLIIGHPDAGEECQIPLNPSQGKRVDVEVWDDRVSAVEADFEINKWFSSILDTQVKLVYMPDESERKIGGKWLTGNDLVGFADGYAYLIAGETSLRDVSIKTGLGSDPRRFRPNLIIEGSEPYDEFYWKKVSIGNTIFSGLKPCERCLVTTVDPDSGHTGKEPLRILSE